MFTRESQTCITTGEPELDEMDKFDADVELARHMVFDGEPTEWALDILDAETIEWEFDDGRLISDCDRYEITEDATYGFISLLFDGDLLIEDAGNISKLKTHARTHRHHLKVLGPKN